MQRTNQNLSFQKMFGLSFAILFGVSELFILGFLIYFRESINTVSLFFLILVLLSLYCAFAFCILVYNLAKIGHTEIPEALILKTYLRALSLRKPKF
jgi:hypothetical protein